MTDQKPSARGSKATSVAGEAVAVGQHFRGAAARRVQGNFSAFNMFELFYLFSNKAMGCSGFRTITPHDPLNWMLSCPCDHPKLWMPSVFLSFHQGMAFQYLSIPLKNVRSEMQIPARPSHNTLGSLWLDTGRFRGRMLSGSCVCVNSVQPLRFVGHVVSEMHVEYPQAFQIMLFRTEGRIRNASPESTENRDFPWFIYYSSRYI